MIFLNFKDIDISRSKYLKFFFQQKFCYFKHLQTFYLRKKNPRETVMIYYSFLSCAPATREIENPTYLFRILFVFFYFEILENIFFHHHF